ncbi:MAG: hypothetical protein R3336_08930 [Phycisphaeraceae bacterium]|nr:hypothetical protein [Phycisphaeraceae bacterium]
MRSLGGHVGLDMGWEETAWASFSHDRDGSIDVVCRLAEDGDLDVTVRPRLEGENIRSHALLPQALAALAYVNPASRGDGERVSPDHHRGDWHEITDELAVAVAASSGVGGVDVGGRGAFLVHKGRIWLPNGVQEPRELQSAEAGKSNGATAADPDVTGVSESGADEAQVTPLPRGNARGDGNNVSILSQQTVRKPADRRARIFGDETDELITQARGAGRRRA